MCCVHNVINIHKTILPLKVDYKVLMLWNDRKWYCFIFFSTKFSTSPILLLQQQLASGMLTNAWKSITCELIAAVSFLNNNNFPAIVGSRFTEHAHCVVWNWMSSQVNDSSSSYWPQYKCDDKLMICIWPTTDFVYIQQTYVYIYIYIPQIRFLSLINPANLWFLYLEWG